MATGCASFHLGEKVRAAAVCLMCLTIWQSTNQAFRPVRSRIMHREAATQKRQQSRQTTPGKDLQ